MNQQNSSFASNLKRQLSFLKTIDQKLEGLRRENERLLRIADNPKVVFSRSSLAGLYRIVNSLVSAGPMYGLTSIEQWAKENRDRLVALGKRGSGPTPEEIALLLSAIGELGRLRDEAMAEVEISLKSADGSSPKAVEEETELSINPDPVPEDETAAAADTSASPEKPKSPSDNPQKDRVEEASGFPFMDEPKAQTIQDSTFSPKSPPKRQPVKKAEKKPLPQEEVKRFRERTSTIPLAIDDLAMLGSTSKIPPRARAKSGGVFWKGFAVLLFVGFAVMTGLYLKEISRPQPDPPSATPIALPPSPIPAVPTTTPVDTEAADIGNEKSLAAASANPAVENEKSEETSAKQDEEKRKKDESVSVEKKKEKSKSVASGAASKPASTPDSAEPKGILYVKAPDDGSAVFVLVDGTSRGKAPVKTVLSPGLHEVVFTADGKRSMRMVPIKADNTKTIVAVKPN